MPKSKRKLKPSLDLTDDALWEFAPGKLYGLAVDKAGGFWDVCYTRTKHGTFLRWNPKPLTLVDALKLVIDLDHDAALLRGSLIKFPSALLVAAVRRLEKE